MIRRWTETECLVRVDFFPADILESTTTLCLFVIRYVLMPASRLSLDNLTSL
jgi:hypothetical protein